MPPGSCKGGHEGLLRRQPLQAEASPVARLPPAGVARGRLVEARRGCTTARGTGRPPPPTPALAPTWEGALDFAVGLFTLEEAGIQYRSQGTSCIQPQAGERRSVRSYERAHVRTHADSSSTRAQPRPSAPRSRCAACLASARVEGGSAAGPFLGKAMGECFRRVQARQMKLAIGGWVWLVRSRSPPSLPPPLLPCLYFCLA